MVLFNAPASIADSQKFTPFMDDEVIAEVMPSDLLKEPGISSMPFVSEWVAPDLAFHTEFPVIYSQFPVPDFSNQQLSGENVAANPDGTFAPALELASLDQANASVGNGGFFFEASPPFAASPPGTPATHGTAVPEPGQLWVIAGSMLAVWRFRKC